MVAALIADSVQAASPFLSHVPYSPTAVSWDHIQEKTTATYLSMN